MSQEAQSLTFEQTFYAFQILTVTTLALAKCSVALFILRLSPFDGHRALIWGVMTVVAIWLAASVFALALQCDVSQPWVLEGARCSGSVSLQRSCKLDTLQSTNNCGSSPVSLSSASSTFSPRSRYSVR